MSSAVRTVVVIGIAALALLAAAPAGAATIHVDCAHANLQKKINHAATGSRLEIEGTCRGRFTIKNKKLKLDGDLSAVLDGNGKGPTLTLDTANVRLSHLVVTGGRIIGGVQAFGPGINARNTKLALHHVVVRGNIGRAKGDSTQAVTALGGGILSAVGGSLAVVDSVVKGNTVSARAGIAIATGGGIQRVGPATIIRSRIETNKAVARSLGTSGVSRGGGLGIGGQSLHVKSSTFAGNQANASSSGGPLSAVGGAIGMAESVSELTISKSVLSGNAARATSTGTAAEAVGGALSGIVDDGLITGTRISGNTAHADSAGDAGAFGGAGSLGANDDLALVSSRVVSNLAEAEGMAGNTRAEGGGLEIEGLLAVRTSTLDRNAASAAGGTTTANGGGIETGSDLTVSRSTISRNRLSADGLTLGGGLYLWESTSTAAVTNSTIAKNKALGSPARGGGIDTFADLDLTSSTVVGNAATIGGGIYVEQPTTTLLATLIAGNSAASSPQCSGPLETGGWNLVGSTIGCVINAPKGSDRLNRPARIGKLGDHGGPTETIPLGKKSPGKNAIPAGSCPVGRDQRGVKRPQGSRCDIGAFERKT